MNANSITFSSGKLEKFQEKVKRLIFKTSDLSVTGREVAT